ncbi:Angiopoietin-related 7, partial [Paramuricea clavata]
MHWGIMNMLNQFKSLALYLHFCTSGKYSVLLLLFWLLHIIKCQGINAADFCFDGNREDHRLNFPHILKRLQAKSRIECILLCFNEDVCCRSINYKKNSLSVEKGNCELLHVTPAEEPGLLEEHPGYDHYVLLQPNRDSTKLNCPDLPCLNGGRCVGGCGNKSSFCNCSRSYAGKYCDKICVDALRFRGNNIIEYGIFVRPSQPLNYFSACSWIKTTEDSDKAILSYAYEFDGTEVSNGLLIFLNPYLRIYFKPVGADPIIKI